MSSLSSTEPGFSKLQALNMWLLWKGTLTKAETPVRKGGFQCCLSSLNSSQTEVSGLAKIVHWGHAGRRLQLDCFQNRPGLAGLQWHIEPWGRYNCGIAQLCSVKKALLFSPCLWLEVSSHAMKLGFRHVGVKMPKWEKKMEWRIDSRIIT